MKSPLFAKALLASVATCLLLSPAFAVTADELARYLGIRTVTARVWMPPNSYVVEIYEIKDGEIGRCLIKGERDWFTDPDGKITIMFGHEKDKQRIVLGAGESMTVSALTSFAPPGACIYPPLPEQLKEGDYMIMGNSTAKNIVVTDPKNYQNGLLLRVSAVRM